MNWKSGFCMIALALVGAGTRSSASEQQEPPLFGPRPAKLSPAARRGEYLVRTGGCHDCHTPWKQGPDGPVPDLSRLLSGHPEQVEIPLPPSLAEPWMIAFAPPMTLYAGPWGISFSANLTPDKETGLGNWSERNFIEAIRSGRHQGRGRPILPPMPWRSVREHTDSDLKAIWAYLQSIPPITNRVPDPRAPPPGASTAGTASPSSSR